MIALSTSQHGDYKVFYFYFYLLLAPLLPTYLLYTTNYTGWVTYLHYTYFTPFFFVPLTAAVCAQRYITLPPPPSTPTKYPPNHRSPRHSPPGIPRRPEGRTGPLSSTQLPSSLPSLPPSPFPPSGGEGGKNPLRYLGASAPPTPVTAWPRPTAGNTGAPTVSRGDPGAELPGVAATVLARDAVRESAPDPFAGVRLRSRWRIFHLRPRASRFGCGSYAGRGAVPVEKLLVTVGLTGLAGGTGGREGGVVVAYAGCQPMFVKTVCMPPSRMS